MPTYTRTIAVTLTIDASNAEYATDMARGIARDIMTMELTSVSVDGRSGHTKRVRASVDTKEPSARREANHAGRAALAEE